VGESEGAGVGESEDEGEDESEDEDEGESEDEDEAEGDGDGVGASVAVVASAEGAASGVDVACREEAASGVEGGATAPSTRLRASADTGPGSSGARSVALPHPLMSSMPAAPASTAVQKRRCGVRMHQTVPAADERFLGRP
jgi:hypothetical protein